MRLRQILVISICLALAVGCSRKPPARTVSEFLEEPMLLEAALVRCTENRAEMRYAAECVNAREAVKLIEARDEVRRREEREAQSQRKREALRRTQQAAAEARRRAIEAERQREEAEYLAQFGVEPPVDAERETDDAAGGGGNSPMAVIPAPVETEPPAGSDVAPLPAAGSNAPVAESAPPRDGGNARDLDEIREELRRRNQDEGGS